jgi:ferredoxin
MKKHLKVQNPQKCIGCELCVFEAQRQLRKVGLNDSLLRILRRSATEFGIVADPKIEALDIEKICKICPRQVFELSEESQNELDS